VKSYDSSVIHSI